MKKSIKNLTAKSIKNTQTIKGGEFGKGTTQTTAMASIRPRLL